MLKTQITGAKYLSPQTNQMTNLNIAVPADSKDTEFGTSDILLAKDVVAYLNALDSDISKEFDAQTDKIDKINKSIKQLVDHNLIKIVTELPTTDIDKNCVYLVPNKDGEGNNVFIEYIYVEAENTFEEVGRIQTKVDLSGYYTKEETDNLILIAKNSAINIHNEDDTKSIKLDINDTEAAEGYESSVNVSLIDDDLNCIANINAFDGFRHCDGEGCYSNLCSTGLLIGDREHTADINSGSILIVRNGTIDRINISTNKKLTEEEQGSGYSPVDISLTDDNFKANINATNGFTHKTEDGYTINLSGYGLSAENGYGSLLTDPVLVVLHGKDINSSVVLNIIDDESSIILGTDDGFKISRTVDNTEGATITGVKSLTAFSNPSATKVWATDGSTVDLTTKANASDVLLKKSASGGYYIEENSNTLGLGAFAASSMCTASGIFAYAECAAIASGTGSHAEGIETTASGLASHAEGIETTASGDYSHAEGSKTTASGDYSHAEGSETTASGFASHAEGYSTIASGSFSHAEGSCNVVDTNAIHSVGIGTNSALKNAEYIYIGINKSNGIDDYDPKNGYKYLIGVGGYDGISTDNTTYKSVQEVIADLTARIEQLETKVRALEAANTPA